VAGGWRTLYNEELRNLDASSYYYGDKIKKDGMDETCSVHAKVRNAYKILVGNPEENKVFGRYSHV